VVLDNQFTQGLGVERILALGVPGTKSPTLQSFGAGTI
jgi:hypothetical protein